jgi:hypothetical protein
VFFKKLFNRDKKENKKSHVNQTSLVGVNQPTHISTMNTKENKSNKFLSYNEEAVYIDHFKHIKTTPKILNMLAEITKPPKIENRHGFSFTVTYDSTERNFIKDSLKYKDKTHPKCEMPHFQTYYSNFAEMNMEQKNWYFYWREQVVNGVYPVTDLSYIYLFVFELINYSFNPSAAFNLSMMHRLYDAYKNQHHIERFPSLIGDMLYELGEYRLAEKWSPNIPQIPPLYKQLNEKQDDLSRISITYWKSYLTRHRESKFFTENKNKIYKTFKDCLPLLEASHLKRTNKKLVDLYFEKREETKQRWLFPGMISIRRTNNFIQYKIENIYPTELLYREVNAFFKLAENVTRLMNNDKRQLQVDEEVFPLVLKDEMIAFLSRPKEKGRFKKVKTKTAEETGSTIPPRPDEQPTIVIEFDDERIKQLKAETDLLVDEVERRAQEHLNDDISDKVDENHHETEDKEEEEKIPVNQQDNGLSKFFSASGDDLDNEQIEVFLGDLSDIEKEFIQQFQDLQWSKGEAALFLKSKGQMIGVILSSLNEKAQESLEDNFLEDDGENLVIYEEFESVVNKLKER